jgi:hypothetical protein
VYFNINTVKRIEIIINWSLSCQRNLFNSSQHTSVIKLTSPPFYPQRIMFPDSPLVSESFEAPEVDISQLVFGNLFLLDFILMKTKITQLVRSSVTSFS